MTRHFPRGSHGSESLQGIQKSSRHGLIQAPPLLVVGASDRERPATPIQRQHASAVVPSHFPTPQVPLHRALGAGALQPKRNSGPPWPVLPPPQSAHRAALPGARTIQRHTAHNPTSSGSVIQARYFFRNAQDHDKFCWTPASLTPGITRLVDEHGVPVVKDGFGVWVTQADALRRGARRAIHAAGAAAADVRDVIVAIGGDDREARSVEQQHPVAVRVAKDVGIALTGIGLAAMTVVVFGPQITVTFPLWLQNAMTIASMTLAVARIGRMGYQIRQADNNDQPTWHIYLRSGLNIALSATMFIIEFKEVGFGLAFSGWLEELYRFIKAAGTAIRDCCRGSNPQRRPLLPA